MKAVKFLFAAVCVTFLFISNSNARTVVSTITTDVTYGIRCDGVIIDWLKGTWTQHLLIHYSKDGKADWLKYQADGTNFVSPSGEVFEMKRIQKYDYPNSDVLVVTYHHNFIGNRGSHYILMRTYQVDLLTGIFTEINEDSKCW